MAETQERVGEKTLNRYSKLENREISSEYKIIHKQAEGGCSVVYDAWRLSDGIHVAVKVLALPTDLSPDDAQQTRYRFFREARILMSLRDEHSVRCYDYGVFNGAPCVVLEFVQGSELQKFVSEYGALPFEYAIDISCQVLSALGEAHRLGIIHRDIKPANIMIVKDSDPPVARLLDFGIATLEEGALGELMKTKFGTIRGTPSYMAPELFSGTAPATRESDIFAMGLVIFEMLTGTQAVMGSSPVHIAYKQNHAPISIPLNIPECLASIIRKCCEKNPSARYHSCEEIRDALQRAKKEAVAKRASCEEVYLEAIRNSGTDNPRVLRETPKRKHHAILFVIEGLVVLGLMGAGVYVYLQREAELEVREAKIEEQQRAAEAARVAEEERKRAEAEKAQRDAQIREAEEKAAAAERARLKAEAEAQAALRTVQEIEKASEQAVQEPKAKKKKSSASETATKSDSSSVKKTSNAHQGKKDNTVIPNSFL